MKCAKNTCLSVIIILIAWATTANTTNAQLSYSRNSIYQYVTKLQSLDPEGKPKTITAYLWIPPNSKKVKGALVMSQNVLEQWLAESGAIRKACADNNLAILWSCRGFFNSKPGMDATNIANIHSLLNDFANITGYPEVARVPWLPIGHSMTNLMVHQLVDSIPSHLIAAISIKGGPGFIHNKSVPILCTAGDFMEWKQREHELLKPHDSIPNYTSILQERAKMNEPLSYFFDPGTGHFDCSEHLTNLIAAYIDGAAKARLSDENDTILKPVNIENGWIAGLPLPNAKPCSAKQLKDAVGEERKNPWFFDKALTVAAQKLCDVDWKRKAQIPTYVNEDGTPAAFSKRNIVWPIPYTTGNDGVTFTLPTTQLSSLPDSFKNAGTPIGHSDIKPKVSVICGNATCVKDNVFRILPGRSFTDKSTTYFIIRQEGNKEYRTSVQPGQLVVDANTKGMEQKITFDSIPDATKKTKIISLHATATSGMPVGFYVKAGPAIIKDGKLIVTDIPIGSKLPIKVIVCAYQWGRFKEPAIQTAAQVERSFWVR